MRIVTQVVVILVLVCGCSKQEKIEDIEAELISAVYKAHKGHSSCDVCEFADVYDSAKKKLSSVERHIQYDRKITNITVKKMWVKNVWEVTIYYDCKDHGKRSRSLEYYYKDGTLEYMDPLISIRETRQNEK